MLTGLLNSNHCLFFFRSLEFIVGFIVEIRNGQKDLGAAASTAYSASLKPYHGWVVRGVFAVSTFLLFKF